MYSFKKHQLPTYFDVESVIDYDWAVNTYIPSFKEKLIHAIDNPKSTHFSDSSLNKISQKLNMWGLAHFPTTQLIRFDPENLTLYKNFDQLANWIVHSLFPNRSIHDDGAYIFTGFNNTSTGINVHIDDCDVIGFNIINNTQWRCWSAPDVYEDIFLNQGECLFQPEGWPHVVKPLEGLRISMGIPLQRENDYVPQCNFTARDVNQLQASFND